jgi:hypothetical protein
MTGSVLLYDPTAPRQDATGAAQRRLDALAGKVVGFIDNAKPNFDHLADDLAELLVAKYGVREIVRRKKRAPSIPAPDAVYDELARHCDLVIAGSGD